jgi:carbohydrate-selective porin OprB
MIGTASKPRTKENTRRRRLLKTALISTAGLAAAYEMTETAQSQTVTVPAQRNTPDNANLTVSSQAPLNMQNNQLSIWEQQYLFGDWGGERSQLAQRGITFDLNNIGDSQTDVSGSQPHPLI